MRQLIESVEKLNRQSRVEQLKLENIFSSNKQFLRELYKTRVVKKHGDANKTEFSLDQNRKAQILSEYFKGLNKFDHDIGRVVHNSQEKFLVDSVVLGAQDSDTRGEAPFATGASQEPQEQPKTPLMDERQSTANQAVDIGQVNQIGKLIEKFIENDDSFNEFGNDMFLKGSSDSENASDSEVLDSETSSQHAVSEKSSSKSKGLSKVRMSKKKPILAEIDYSLDIKNEEVKSIYENFRTEISKILAEYTALRFD